MGLNECLKSTHLQPYEVLEEKSGQDVAQFKWTIGVMGSRNILLSSYTEESLVKHVELDSKDNEELLELIKTPLDDFT